MERIHHELYVAVREQQGREPSPTVAIIDSQTAKGSQKGGSWLDPSGYDAGKKVKGRKRHILVDTLGLLLNVVIHPADVQDRDGALHLLRRARRLFPFIEHIFADGGYAGRKMALTAWRTGAWSLQIVRRSDVAGFEVLPKRWIVERTFCCSVPECSVSSSASMPARGSEGPAPSVPTEQLMNGSFIFRSI